jgi:hypothetical protein
MDLCILVNIKIDKRKVTSTIYYQSAPITMDRQKPDLFKDEHSWNKSLLMKVPSTIVFFTAKVLNYRGLLVLGHLKLWEKDKRQA